MGYYVKRTPKPKGLKRKAWDTFSKWVRNRDRRCVTCGSTNNLQGGHFWHGCLDFDEMNINAQCVHCNVHLSGNGTKYSVYLLDKYGLEAFKDLEKRHYLALKGERYSDQELQEIIDKYKLSKSFSFDMDLST